MSARFLIILAAVALLLSGSGTAFGQAVYGSISATITDPTGAAIPNARITITDTGKGVTFNTQTNDSGNYAQTHLIAGIYQVEVDAVTQVNARLTVGAVGETVSVAGEAPLLKTERSDVSDTMTQKAMMELPVLNRDLNRIYFLVPGVQ